tara:strand:- start:835 stop:1158 length:324 start_codon:yes stop_codon:yes gene_type:complete
MPYFEGSFIERIEHRIQVKAPSEEAARQYLMHGDALDNYEFENGDYLDMEYDNTHALGDRQIARLHPDDVHCVSAEGKLIIPKEQIHPSVRINEPRLRGGQLPKEDE